MLIGKRTFNFSEMAAIMAVLNVTPDSFYDGSRISRLDEAVDRAVQLEAKGSDIIDIGGESSRPGSLPLSVSDELQRVIPVVETVCRTVNVPVSVDTTKAEVAERAINAGASLINDISAMTFEPSMADVVKNYEVPIVLMHMKGKPENMQKNPTYDDPVKEISEWLLNRAAWAEKKGVKAEKIILDPGIGFGKRLEDNLKLIRHFAAAVAGRYPVLIGHSRKRFIGELTGKHKPSDRLFGSIGAAVMAVECGASIIRVHDPEETRDAIMVAKSI
jgi:dihydropteroate synthase